MVYCTVNKDILTYPYIIYGLLYEYSSSRSIGNAVGNSRQYAKFANCQQTATQVPQACFVRKYPLSTQAGSPYYRLVLTYRYSSYISLDTYVNICPYIVVVLVRVYYRKIVQASVPSQVLLPTVALRVYCRRQEARRINSLCTATLAHAVLYLSHAMTKV